MTGFFIKSLTRPVARRATATSDYEPGPIALWLFERLFHEIEVGPILGQVMETIRSIKQKFSSSDENNGIVELLFLSTHNHQLLFGRRVHIRHLVVATGDKSAFHDRGHVCHPRAVGTEDG